MVTMCNAALMHVEITRPRDVTEPNNDDVIKLGDVYYQTEPILSIFERDLINDKNGIGRHLHVAMLQCWAKFSKFSKF